MDAAPIVDWSEMDVNDHSLGAASIFAKDLYFLNE